MLWNICYAVGILLAIVGLVEIIQSAAIYLLGTKNENNFILLIPMKGHVEDAELLIRNAITKMKNQKIVCLDLDMDDETRKICNIMSTKHRIIHVLNKNELKIFLTNI